MGTLFYRSGIDATMSHHLGAIAKRLQALAGLKPGGTVLDMASSDFGMSSAAPFWLHKGRAEAPGKFVSRQNHPARGAR
jgi:hypothetical protein